MTLCGLNLKKVSPTSKNRAPIHHESAKSLRPGESFIELFLSSWVLRRVFCGNIFWKFSVLGNLTCAQEPRWLRIAWWTRTWLQDPGRQYLTISSCVSVRMSRYWACGRFGEHERGVRVARGAAECNSSLLSALQTSQVLNILTYAQLQHELMVL